MACRFLGVLSLCLAIGQQHTAISSDMSDDMSLVPAGEFLMGSPAGTDGLPDEQPQRRVYLSSFFIDRHEVTNEAYAEFVNFTGHRIPENANPSSTLWMDRAPMDGIA